MTKPTHLFTTIGIGAAATVLAALAGCTRPSVPAAQDGKDGKDGKAAQIERGRQLVAIGGCNDCHTPLKFDAEVGMPVPDMSRMLSGHPEGAPDPAGAPAGHDMAVINATMTSFKLPFGTVYTANLTPDKDTGLGSWTEEMFVRAVRTGRHMGGNGRPILPPMPWPNVGQLSDGDIKAVFAFLQSIPAIRNDVPAPKVPDAVMDGIAASYEKMMKKMQAAAQGQAQAAVAQR
ncbi:MAG TPA: diheme cytochrome c-553 [Polyangia bacterium]